jgi:hypothetical protein
MEMKNTAVMIGISLFALLLAVFVSYFSAVSRAKALMAPALERGWHVYETSILPATPRLNGPAWWIRFDNENEIVDFPPAVMVSFFGEMDTYEIDDLLQHYERAEQNAAGQSATRPESK